MDDLFSIGELSRCQNISKQTLIYYDKIGLFKPAWVDPQNGYRYYSARQIDYLDTILIMKKIGFSLKEIQELMEHYTLESSLLALRRQAAAVERQIEELRLLKSRIEHRCVQMEASLAASQGECQIKLEEREASRILIQPVEAPYTMREISIATKQCFASSFQKKLPIFFQCGVIVPLDRILQGRCTEASHAFVPVGSTGRDENIRKLPAGKCVSLCHVGDYASIGRSYRKLLDYCREQRLEILSDSYEYCINDYLTSGDESEYITRIVFYVGDAGAQ